jgi:hypothetical protein
MLGLLEPPRCEAPLEQRTGHLVSVPGPVRCQASFAAQRPAFVRIRVTQNERTCCAAQRVDYERANTRARGTRS